MDTQIQAGKPVHRCPAHTEKVFDVRTLPLVARWGEKELLLSRVDAIVVSGHSGLVLAGALSLLTRLPVFAVRKSNEGRPVASGGPVSGIAPNGPVKRFAWVDDLICSGGTMRYACGTVYSEKLTATPIPAAVLLYCDYSRDGWKNLCDSYQEARWAEMAEGRGYALGAEEGWHQFSYQNSLEGR